MELTYKKHGEYYLPDLDIPAKEKVSVNRYGRMHGNYLEKNNRTAYNELLFSGRLNRYLAEVGEQAEKMLALLTERYAAAENVTEEMKMSDQMGWVRAMNSIRNRAEEVVLSELVYC
ncbi:MAG TPA: TnpV protein [Lachnospiraceae bacterium]|nr:TnpV protein [Lachnospiraceae bacterium]